jgi:hypothetical protein
MRFDSAPNHLMMVGPFTNKGLAGLQPLARLANLSFLGCGGELCDDGFASLSRSQTLEHLWGRECPNLQSRGFAALAAMPALAGLAVSCKRVDDEALSALPRFPALKELLPMDVPDAGFRHVGACAQLETLRCMYKVSAQGTAAFPGNVRVRYST